MAFDFSTAKPEKKTGFDFSTAKPGVPAAPATPAWTPDTAPSEIVGAVAEPLMAMGSGMAGKVAGDIAGLGTVGAGMLGMTEKDPEAVKRSVEQAMQYQPRTKAGASAYNPLNFIPQAIGAGVERFIAQPFGGAAEKLGAGRAGRAGVEEAARQAIGFAGLKGAGKGAGAIERGIAEKQAALDIEKGEMAVRDESLKRFLDAGYEIPRETVLGKFRPAANISIKNERNATKKIAEDAGLKAGDALSQSNLKALEAPHLKVYDDMVREAGESLSVPAEIQDKLRSKTDAIKQAIKDSPATNKALRGVPAILEQYNKPTLSTKRVFEDIKILRNQASKELRSQTYDAIKEQEAYARLDMAKELEDIFEMNLSAKGQPGLVDSFRNARTQLAKLNDIKSVVNPVTGMIDLPELASYSKTKNLTGALKDAADFASTFKSASRAGQVEKPRFNLYDAILSGAFAASGHPGMAAGEIATKLGGSYAAEAGMFPRTVPTYEVGAARRATPEALRALGIAAYGDIESRGK